MKSFSDRLKEVRGSKTLAAFSKEIGINLTTYQHYEAGTRKPNVKLILQVAVNCGVSADWLLGLSPHRNADNAPPSRVEYGAGIAAESPASASDYCPLCSAKDELIASQRETIEALKSSVGFTRRGGYAAKR